MILLWWMLFVFKKRDEGGKPMHGSCCRQLFELFESCYFDRVYKTWNLTYFITRLLFSHLFAFWPKLITTCVLNGTHFTKKHAEFLTRTPTVSNEFPFDSDHCGGVVESVVKRTWYHLRWIQRLVINSDGFLSEPVGRWCGTEWLIWAIEGMGLRRGGRCESKERMTSPLGWSDFRMMDSRFEWLRGFAWITNKEEQNCCRFYCSSFDCLFLRVTLFIRRLNVFCSSDSK